MPKKADLLNQKLDRIFADRHEQLDLFKDMLASVDLDHSLLAVRGIGGIGKTMLLNAYQKLCIRHKVPVAFIDVGAQKSIVEVLRSIRDQVLQTNPGVSLKSFDEAVGRYLTIDEQLRSLGTIPVGVLDFLSKARVLAPSHMSSQNDQNSPKQEDYELIISRIRQHLPKEDASFFLAPEEMLTKELLKGINAYAETQRLCVIFDRYEAVPSVLDRWICQDFFAELEQFVIVVLSGRTTLPPEWNRWRLLTKSLELPPFSTSKVQELLGLLGITNEHLIKQITDFAGGVPLAISLAAQLIEERSIDNFATVSDRYNVIEELVKVLVRDASPELESMLEVCSTLHWFNEESISALSGGSVQPEVYKLLRGYDFIRRGRYGFEVHDRVRDFINQDLAQRAPIRYRKLNQLAGDYYDKLLTEGSSQDHQTLLLEKLYHKLRADETEGMAALRTVYNDAAWLMQTDICQALIEVASKAPLQNKVHHLWIEYFRGLLARQNSNFAEAERIFTQLAGEPLIESDKELKAELYFYLAQVSWYLCNFPRSLEMARKAIDLNHELRKFRFENRALGVVGLIQDRWGDSIAGVETVMQMVTQSRDTNDKISEAYALNSIGYFSWHTGKWDRAEEALLSCRQVCHELGSKFVECYPVGHVALLYTTIDDFEQAYALLKANLEMCRQTNHREMECKTLQNFSEFERRNGRYEAAVRYAEEAHMHSDKMKHEYYQSDSLRLWGQALLALGQTQEGAEKHRMSLALAEKLHAENMVMRNQVALHRLAVRKQMGPVEFRIEDVSRTAREKQYYNLLSDILLIEAESALDGGRFEDALNWYSEACRAAVQYNWHWLDRAIIAIVAQCTSLKQSGKAGQAAQLYDYLIHFWREERLNDTPLSEVEEKAPRVRKGRGAIVGTLIGRLISERAKLQGAS